jgi:hypothetical protein
MFSWIKSLLSHLPAGSAIRRLKRGVSGGVYRVGRNLTMAAPQGGALKTKSTKNKISGVGTILGLLLAHVLPGPNKQRARRKSMILS